MIAGYKYWDWETEVRFGQILDRFGLKLIHGLVPANKDLKPFWVVQGNRSIYEFESPGGLMPELEGLVAEIAKAAQLRQNAAIHLVPSATTWE